MFDNLINLYGDNIVSLGYYSGCSYAVVMAPHGLNGYVELPDNHPWIDFEDCYEIPAYVHGKITMKHDNIVGFDTCHMKDAYHPYSQKAYDLFESESENVASAIPNEDGDFEAPNGNIALGEKSMILEILYLIDQAHSACGK